MKIDQQPVKFIVINKQANSLYSLIADGNHRSTLLGRDTWKSLIGSKASLQHNCNREGFNAKSDRKQNSKARIGILSNNENECQSCDSRIGFGTGGYPDDSNTCGNEALAIYEADNSDKHIKAMGYILVQWKVNNKKGNCHFWGITWFLEEQKGGSVKTLERFKGDYSNFLGQWRRWGGGGGITKFINSYYEGITSVKWHLKGGGAVGWILPCLAPKPLIPTGDK